MLVEVCRARRLVGSHEVAGQVKAIGQDVEEPYMGCAGRPRLDVAQKGLPMVQDVSSSCRC